VENRVIRDSMHVEEHSKDGIHRITSPSALPGKIKIPPATNRARGHHDIVSGVNPSRHFRQDLEVAGAIAFDDEDAVARFGPRRRRYQPVVDGHWHAKVYGMIHDLQIKLLLETLRFLKSVVAAAIVYHYDGQRLGHRQ